jgi:hypothetical protein
MNVDWKSMLDEYERDKERFRHINSLIAKSKRRNLAAHRTGWDDYIQSINTDTIRTEETVKCSPTHKN